MSVTDCRKRLNNLSDMAKVNNLVWVFAHSKFWQIFCLGKFEVEFAWVENSLLFLSNMSLGLQ